MAETNQTRRARYFDNAATTPLDDRVLHEMLPFFGEAFGNPNSIHAFGQFARNAVEVARNRVAQALGADDPEQILFTSGATEANNQVLRSFPFGAVSPFEHSAVREPAKLLGFEVLKNDGLTVLPPKQRVPLLSLMSVNNEIGSIWNPSEFEPFADFVHSDITQRVGKLPIDLTGIEFASLSAHKFYGPKGIGALFFRQFPPDPLHVGGEQEFSSRGGTLNVPGIVGMGMAIQLATEELEQNLKHAKELRSVLLDGLSTCSDWQLLGGEQVSPYIMSVSFLGVEGETLVVEVDRAGFAISSGAACSSHSHELSPVLKVLNIEEAWSRGTIRISFGRYCTVESAYELSRALRRTVENLRRMDVA